MDTVDKKTRSRIMASVRQRDTGPELSLRRVLHRLGMRYRLHDRKLPGSPDLVFTRFRAVVFVHGCFWHVHRGCRYATRPSSRKVFWEEKFEANEKRDKRDCEALLSKGWRVLIVWQCAIKTTKKDRLERLGSAVADWLHGDDRYAEMGEGFLSKVEEKQERHPR